PGGRIRAGSPGKSRSTTSIPSSGRPRRPWAPGGSPAPATGSTRLSTPCTRPRRERRWPRVWAGWGRRTTPAGKLEEPLQAALVAVDPATGELTALVGGRNYGETQFNRAVDARRQPGSAFKPFVLLAAMKQAVVGKGSITLASRISGERISVEAPNGRWAPANFEGKEYGVISVRRMIEESVNTA